MPYRRLFVVVSLLLLVAGCMANKRADSLETTLRAYHSTLRWGGFGKALDFVGPDYREQHPLDDLRTARYRQVRIVGYEEGGGPTPVSDGKVRQTAKISVVNKHTQRERAVIDHQIWEWDDEAERWWLTTGLPDITTDSSP